MYFISKYLHMSVNILFKTHYMLIVKYIYEQSW